MSRDYSNESPGPGPTPTGPKVSVSGWDSSTKYGNLDSNSYNFYQSTNYHQEETTSSMTITALETIANFSFYIRQNNDTEAEYDYVTVLNNSGRQIATLEGTSSATSWTQVNVGTFTAGQKVTIRYTKDDFLNAGEDRGYVAIDKGLF